MKYGKRLIDGYWQEGVAVGTEMTPSLVIGFKPDCAQTMLNMALAVSPEEACIRHLTGLMSHKNMGSGALQVKLKGSDYVEALKDYPEWVIWQVCKNLIINDKRGFVPSIAELKEHCGLVQAALERRREGALALMAPVKPKRAYEPPTRREKPKAEWTDAEWQQWVDEAFKMIATAKDSRGLLDPEGWEKTYFARKAEADTRQYAGEAKAQIAEDVAEDVSPFA